MQIRLCAKCVEACKDAYIVVSLGDGKTGKCGHCGKRSYTLEYGVKKK